MEMRRAKQSIVASFAAVEVALLVALLGELEDVMAEMAPDDPATQRLFPAAFPDDAAATTQFRELTEQSLQQERRDRYEQCRAELPAAGGQVVITSQMSGRWLVVLNDMRLALGTRLGVTAEPMADAETDDSDRGARALYDWLTGVQDQLLSQVMR